MDESSRRRYSSKMDDSSRRRHSLTRSATPPSSILMHTTTTSRPRRTSSLRSSDRHRVKLLRYIMLVVGVGSFGTFLLQALSLSSFQGANGQQIQDPTSTGLLLFGRKRQLESSDRTSRKEFAGIAEQVRAQIAEQGLANQKEKNVKPSFLYLEEDEEEEEDFEIPMAEDNKPRPPPETAKSYDFSNPPPDHSLTKDEYFAACLLIKDDNHWLIEWLAYHYHVMPLRRLIVAVDPDSQTTPEHILARWNDRMNITTWHDEDFMKPVENNKMVEAYKNNTQLMYHRHRQNTFFTHCLKQVKQEGVPWIHLTDTDEFIALNYASGRLYNLTKHHPIQQPGSVLRFLNHHQEATQEVPKCIYTPRYMFGNKESPKGLVERNVPKKSQVLKGTSFLTQRFMFRHPRKMQNGKNLVHLKAIKELKPMGNVHRVSSSCPTHQSVKKVDHAKNTLVKVHHYLGTKEQYFFRMDPRGRGSSSNTSLIAKGLGNYFQRDSQRYEQLNVKAIYSDSGDRGWIKGFVDAMGVETAEYLLKDIGQVGVE